MEKELIDFFKKNYSVIEISGEQLRDVLGDGPHLAIVLCGHLEMFFPDMGKKEAFDSPEFQASFIDAAISMSALTIEQALEMFAILKED